MVRGRICYWSAEARYAAALTRAGALDGLSIGFRAAKARREGRLRVLSAVELWEVSLVIVPPPTVGGQKVRPRALRKAEAAFQRAVSGARAHLDTAYATYE